MAAQKLERNLKIWYQIKTGTPYSVILNDNQLKSKKSIYIIVKRIDQKLKEHNQELSP